MGNENIVEIRNLRKEYPGFSLKDLNLDIPKGTIIGLVGQNGAGKSTLIYSMLDLLNTDSGEVLFWGQKLKDNTALKEDIGVVFDSLNVYETFTPAMIEKVFKEGYKSWDSKLYEKLLDEFGLDSKKEVKSFSKGMKVKLSIAIALAHSPKLLILDEVTDGLDPVMRESLLGILLDFIQDEEKAILISSHNMTDVERIADYITYIDNGEIVFCKNKDDLRYTYGIARVEPEKLADVASKDYALQAKKSGYQYDVIVSNKERAMRDFPGLAVDDATLDEIMLIFMTGNHLKKASN